MSTASQHPSNSISDPGTPTSDSPRLEWGRGSWVHIGNNVSLHFSNEVIDALNRLLVRTGDTPEDLFRKALALYTLASDAHTEGKAVGTATSPDVLETEYVGF